MKLRTEAQVPKRFFTNTKRSVKQMPLAYYEKMKGPTLG